MLLQELTLLENPFIQIDANQIRVIQRVPVFSINLYGGPLIGWNDSIDHNWTLPVEVNVEE